MAYYSQFVRNLMTKASNLDNIIAAARNDSDKRALGYREQALKLYPWICGRCTREFIHTNLRELTVHHRDHNHDNNPNNGSNWELLCVYCHDNEHQRLEEAHQRGESLPEEVATVQTIAVKHNPFAGLASLIKK